MARGGKRGETKAKTGKGDDDHDSLSVKAGHTGVEVKSRGGFSALSRLGRWARPEHTSKVEIIEAVTERVTKLIRSGKVIPPELASFLEVATGQQVTRLLNQGAIADRAEVLLEERNVPMLSAPSPNDPRVEEAPDQDWLNHFFSDAGDISDEQMQEVYARILAGEYQTKGSFARQTLQLLRGLDHDTANTLNAIHPFVVSGFFLFGYDSCRDFYNTKGINYADFLVLKESGLVQANTSIGSTRPGERTIELRYGGKVIRGIEVAMDDDDRTMLISGLSMDNLTRAGRQLLRIREQPIDPGFTVVIAAYLRARCRCTVSWRPENSIEWTDFDIDRLDLRWDEIIGRR